MITPDLPTSSLAGCARRSAGAVGPTHTADVAPALAAPAPSAHVGARRDSTAPRDRAVVTVSVPHGCEGSASSAVASDIPGSIATAVPTITTHCGVDKAVEPLDEPIDTESETVRERDGQTGCTDTRPSARGRGGRVHRVSTDADVRGRRRTGARARASSWGILVNGPTSRAARRGVSSRVAASLGAGALAGAALALGLAGPASAHDYVVDSTPSDGATLTELPDSWTVTANEPLLALEGNGKAFAIVITDADGLYYGDGCVEVAGPTMAAPASLGEPGDYAMTFQFVSSDGHTLSETYGFTYDPVGDEPVTAGSSEAPECGGSPGGESTGDRASSDAGDEGAAMLAGVGWIGGGLLVATAIATIMVRATRRRPAGD